LAQEAPLPRVRFLGARPVVHEDLDRDAPIELGIERCVHDAHAARADALEQDIASDGRATRERERLGPALAGAPGLPRGGPPGNGVERIVGHRSALATGTGAADRPRAPQSPRTRRLSRRGAGPRPFSYRDS